MDAHDERMAHLAELGVNATNAASGLEDQHWPNAETRGRVQEVLDYVQLVIEGSDGALVSRSAGAELESALTDFASAPEQYAAGPEQWIDRLLEVTARLPRTQGRDFEQLAKRAAKKFQQSAQQRFAAVERQAADAQTAMDELATVIIERRAEVDGIAEQFRAQQEEAIEARFSQIDARTQDLQTSAERHAQSIELLATEQSEAFRKAQDERSEEHREREQKYEARFDEVEDGAIRRAEALVAEIDGMKERSAKMVGAIGITGTAERYGKEFTEQKGTANKWRLVTLGIGALAVVVAVIAAFDHKATTAGTKLAIAILLGGVAAYTARQSARHRAREEHARKLQLDLTAFPVFIEALPEEDRDVATVWMAERSFLGAKGTIDDEDDGGPTLLSQIMTRRKKAQPANDDE
jgi:hypothetical protein